MSRRNAAAVSLIISVFAFSASAQTSRTEDAIRYRKATMVMIKWHFDRLSQIVKGSIPFARDEAERNAVWLDALSKNAAEGFVSGSQEGDTRALAAVWNDRQKFHGLVERFQADASRLRETVRKGEMAAIKTQLDNMARTCKSCHDDFKKT